MTIVGYLTYPLAEKVLIFFAGVKSFRAIQSPDPKDDKQWLTFWLLFGLFDLALFVGQLVGWLIPFYDEMKVAVIIFLGVFGGAEKIYPVLEPILLQGDEVAKKYEPWVQEHMKKVQAQAQDAAEAIKKKAATKAE